MKKNVPVWHGAFWSEASNRRKKITALYTLLLFFNIGAWICALVMFAGNPVLLVAASLAYTFGLRHGFDADHIASIDIVTRKLMQRNGRPVTVGLHFAIGHSLALVVFVTGIALLARWDSTGKVVGIIGSASVASTFFSASFLVVMAAANLTIVSSTYRAFRQARNGCGYDEKHAEALLNKRGFLVRIFKSLFRLVDESWHMIVIGFLFGLGFDTATEVSLLGIAGVEAARGLSVWVILVFPMLFAAGMALVDTTDSALMVRAYGWAFRNPVRKLYYNLTITIVSAAVALVVAGIEILALMSDKLGLKGQLWVEVNLLSDHWEFIGVVVASIFFVSWVVSVLAYRIGGYERTDAVV